MKVVCELPYFDKGCWQCPNADSCEKKEIVIKNLQRKTLLPHQAEEIADKFSFIMLYGRLAADAIATPDSVRTEVKQVYAAELLVEIKDWYDAEMERINYRYDVT
ncbi:MAG: hypothetical protein PHS04_13980 [Tissierellia bacterium]|nr:hypothetical protein [Tissierellia bacterium]